MGETLPSYIHRSWLFVIKCLFCFQGGSKFSLMPSESKKWPNNELYFDIDNDMRKFVTWYKYFLCVVFL